MARNSTERVVASATWSRADPLFSAHCQHGAIPPFNIYKCGIMIVLKGCYTDKLNGGIRKKFASLNLAYSFVIRSECSFREGCLLELAHSPCYSQRALELGRMLSLLAVRLLVRGVSHEK